MSHRKPVTRRDFLAQGLLGTSTFVAMPSLLAMLATKRAFGAATCTAAKLSTKTPFICIDLAGGANIPGSNVIVGKKGGQMDLLAAYDKLGLPSGMNPTISGQVNTELGLAFHADSAMLRGIKSVTAATTRANIDGIVLCSQSNDDTGNNPHNPMYWIAKSGLTGMLAGLTGTNNSLSGGNAAAPPLSINPAIRPITIAKPADARSLITLGQLNVLFTPAKVDKILQAVETMSGSHLDMFQAKDLPAQVRDLVECGYTQVRAVTQDNPDNYDPLKDPMVNLVFPNIANNTEDQKVATVAKLVLDNVSGAGTIQKGGYDYHSGNRSDGETMDFAAGVAIGQCLELAARKGKDLMIYVFTDGGIVSSGAVDNSVGGRGKGIWSGDSGSRSSAFILTYRAGNGRPALRNNLRQIGSFVEAGQAVDPQSSLIATDIEKLSMSVVLNYMALDGSEGQFASVVGGVDPFMTAKDTYLLFNKLA